jgi:3-methyladenine DNA glycosylase AlkD
MDASEVIDELRRRGTGQNRKIYRRHGADADVFGVSAVDLKALKKKIKVDQAVAEALWRSGNHDARVLAAMVADPARIAAKRLDAWADDLTNHVLAGALADLAARTPEAVPLMERWTASGREWVASAGWSVLAGLAKLRDDLDPLLDARLATIERTIHDAPNRVRHSMNNALIAIGLRGPALREKALAAAARIGKVVVDHGETGCKTPDAAAYIRKAVQRTGC